MIGRCGWCAALVVALLAVGSFNPPKPPGSLSKSNNMDNTDNKDNREEGVARPFEQTFEAQSEWFVVDVVQAYGKFMESRPFYDFDYMGITFSYWQRLSVATREATLSRGAFATATSIYFHMQLFMGVMLTANFAVIGAVSVPIRLAIGGQEPDTISIHLEASPLLSNSHSIELDLRRDFPRSLERLSHSSDSKIVKWRVREWPRYKRFIETLREYAKEYPGLRVTQIDAHTSVSVKFEIGDQQSPVPLTSPLIGLPVERILDDYRIDGGGRFVIALADVRLLTQLITAPHPHAKLVHIFDF